MKRLMGILVVVSVLIITFYNSCFASDKEYIAMHIGVPVAVLDGVGVAVDTSGEQEGNFAENCMDGDLTTRWGVEGEGWVYSTLPSPKGFLLYGWRPGSLISILRYLKMG